MVKKEDMISIDIGQEEVAEEGVDPRSTVAFNGKRIADSILGELHIHGRAVPTPSFILESTSGEDFLTLLMNIHLLKEPHIVSLPAFHWAEYSQSIPTLIDPGLGNKAREFAFNHHILFYEPPEFYRYVMAQKLVKHALRGDASRIKSFYNTALVKGNKEEALAQIPAFEREFVRNQWNWLMAKHYSNLKQKKAKALAAIKKIPKKPDETPDVESSWTNMGKPYSDHITTGILEAMNLGKNGYSCSFVPVVRTLKSSSEKYVRDQVLRCNVAAAIIWRELRGPSFASGRPWFHLSLDSSVFIRNGEVNTNPDDLIGLVDDDSLDPTIHCGICITMTGWLRAWAEGRPRKRLERFISEISQIALSKNLPVYAARSKWVGIDLLDMGLAFAGTLFNGNEKVSDTSSGIDSRSPEAFGKTPIYGECTEVPVTELFTANAETGILDQPKPLHRFEGIPDCCEPSFLSDSTLFRVAFAKPRRLATHINEARENRGALKVGIVRPGREYIEKSKLWEIAKSKKLRLST